MTLDKNAADNGNYKIRSLYFDNLNDKALMEKINGLYRKEKFRIRYYNDDDSFIRLEKKCKLNSLGSKQSTRITRKECASLLDGDVDFLKESGLPLFLEFYSKIKYQLLKPKTIVDFIREAYLYPPGNVRITFDKSVRTAIYSTSLFDRALPTIEALDSRYIILEIKYDKFLPELIKDIIQTNERRATAVSKYALSRIYG